MNILCLSELFYPHGSGAELATYLYAKMLSKNGFNVVVVTNKFNGEPDVSRNGNLTVFRLPLLKKESSVKYSILPRFDVLLSSFTNKLMKASDVIYIPRLWYSAILLARTYGKPVVTHIHDYIPICPLSNLQGQANDAVCSHNGIFCSPKCIYSYEKEQRRDLKESLASTFLNVSIGRLVPKLIKLSDAIICVSKTQKEIIVTKDRALHNKTYVIHNPFPIFPEDKVNGEDFGYFGGYDVMKGLKVLCQASCILRNSGYKQIKIHSTKFETSNKKLISALKRLGFLSYAKLEKEMFENVYSNIRVVVVPSIWHEPWPYIIVEALLRKRLVIASRVGGIPEQTEGCKGAFLFESRDYHKLAELMKFVNELNKEEVVDMGCMNRENFLRKFNNESSIKKFISLCESLI